MLVSKSVAQTVSGEEQPIVELDRRHNRNRHHGKSLEKPAPLDAESLLQNMRARSLRRHLWAGSDNDHGTDDRRRDGGVEAIG